MKHTEVETLKEILTSLRGVVDVLKREADAYHRLSGRHSETQAAAILCIESGIETIAESDERLAPEGREEDEVEDDYLGRFKENRDARAICND